MAPVRQIAAAAVTRIFAPVPRLPMEVTFLPVINQFRKPYLNCIPQFHFNSPLLFGCGSITLLPDTQVPILFSNQS